MANVSILNFGDGVDRKIRDAESVHTISINGTAQSVSNNHADLDIDTRIEAIVNQIPIFTVNLTTGELVYAEGPYSFEINTTTGNLEWEVTV